METRKFGEAKVRKLDNPKFKEEEEGLRKRFTEQVKLEEARFRQWEQHVRRRPSCRLFPHTFDQSADCCRLSVASACRLLCLLVAAFLLATLLDSSSPSATGSTRCARACSLTELRLKR